MLVVEILYIFKFLDQKKNDEILNIISYTVLKKFRYIVVIAYWCSVLKFEGCYAYHIIYLFILKSF